jgi:hypothetical protein
MKPGQDDLGGMSRTCLKTNPILGLQKENGLYISSASVALASYRTGDLVTDRVCPSDDGIKRWGLGR